MPTKPTAKPTPAELIDLLIASAPRLIAAGVTSLAIGELSCTLAPPPPSADPPRPDPVQRSHPNPLNDPSTYPGGRVPGFTLDDMPRNRR